MAQPIALKRKSPEFEDEHRKRGRVSLLAAFQKGASPTTVGTSSVEASATANPSVHRHDAGASGSDDVGHAHSQPCSTSELPGPDGPPTSWLESVASRGSGPAEQPASMRGTNMSQLEDGSSDYLPSNEAPVAAARPNAPDPRQVARDADALELQQEELLQELGWGIDAPIPALP